MPRPARRGVAQPREAEANTTPTRRVPANAITAAIPPFMLDTPPHAPFVMTPAPPSDHGNNSVVPERTGRRQALGQQQTPTTNGHHDPNSSQASTSAGMPVTGNHDDGSLADALAADELRELEGLRDISSLATWTLSSAKPGCALPQLRHPSPNFFWQSDGPQPHILTLHFFKLVAIVKMRIYLDFELDESYTPTKIRFYAGMSEGGLVEFGSWQVMDMIDPETGEARSTIEDVKGWIDVSLKGVGGRESRYHEAVDEPMGEEVDQERAPGDVLKAMVVQVRICENHQNGKDTHVRGFQVFARDEQEEKARKCEKVTEAAAAARKARPHDEKARPHDEKARPHDEKARPHDEKARPHDREKARPARPRHWCPGRRARHARHEYSSSSTWLLSLSCAHTMDSFKRNTIAFTALVLPDWTTMSLVQAAFILVLLSLVIACAFNALYCFCRQTPTVWSRRLSVFGALAAVLLYCYLADRTLVFRKVDKVVDETTFICLCLVALVFGAATACRNPPAGAGKAEHDDETVELLPRQQSEEWKGWMQVAILLYHYFGMSRVLHVYRLIRILVGSYLFLTGYGHATYFLRTDDFSLRRVVSVLTRLNMLACILPFVMGSKYDMYYFPALSTFWFLVTWTVVPRTSGTLAWHVILIRILVAIFCIELLLGLPGVWQKCAYFIHKAKVVDLDATEFLFRLSLDRFVPYAGILAACANERGRRLAPLSWRLPHLNRIAAVASLCLLVPYFLFLSKLNSKEEANRYHPFTEIVPILAFITLRNSHPTVRKYHSSMFSWVGRYSLETFVLQYHIWLAADAKKTLSISGFPTRLPADPPLASHGVRQAEETGVLLAEKLFEAAASDRLRIYSSLFYRCLETLRPTVQLLQAKLDAADSDKRRQVLVRGERGVGEWFGRAWFTQPSPGTAQRLKTEFFPWLDDGYQSLLIPHEKGERIEELHKRVAAALELLVTDVEEEYSAQGRGDEDVTVLICGHAAQIIATGRALTGSVPDDYDEEDFRCYTCGISKFVRSQPRTATAVGVLGAWDCVVNSDCAHLSQGAERGWHFHGDESFDSYGPGLAGGGGVKTFDGGVAEGAKETAADGNAKL
ncbi:hypothetical protein DV735_g1961, partial [Chaetothyriales sp. CBS 134920]